MVKSWRHDVRNALSQKSNKDGCQSGRIVNIRSLSALIAKQPLEAIGNLQSTIKSRFDRKRKLDRPYKYTWNIHWFGAPYIGASGLQ